MTPFSFLHGRERGLAFQRLYDSVFYKYTQTCFIYTQILSMAWQLLVTPQVQLMTTLLQLQYTRITTRIIELVPLALTKKIRILKHQIAVQDTWGL